MKDIYSEIICNDRVKGGYWRMGLKTGWRDYAPGQFLMLDVPGEATFLRRPFGIARLKDGVAEVYYKVVGKGTEAMTRLEVGSRVWVMGPLGNGYQMPDTRCQTPHPLPSPHRGEGEGEGKSLLVAGGYGIAPLLGLAEKLQGQGVRGKNPPSPPFPKGGLGGLKGGASHLFYGARTVDDLILLDEFEKLGVELHITTEDGSKGEKGLVTDVLEDYFKTPHPRPLPRGERGRGEGETRATLYACGPKLMLDAISSLVPRLSSFVSCQLSLESYMACGIGACLGCVVKDAKGEYVRVCKEGPVFNANELCQI